MEELDLSTVVFLILKKGTLGVHRFAAHVCVYLVGGLEPWNFMTFHSVGKMSSSQLTFTPSFFRGVGGSTTNQYGFIMVLYGLMWIDAGFS